MGAARALILSPLEAGFIVKPRCDFWDGRISHNPECAARLWALVVKRRCRLLLGARVVAGASRRVGLFRQPGRLSYNLLVGGF